MGVLRDKGYWIAGTVAALLIGAYLGYSFWRGNERVFLIGATSDDCAHISFPLGVHPVAHLYARAAINHGIGTVWCGAGTNTPSEAQLELIWANIRTILASAGMSVDNIVRLTSYLRDAAYAEANARARTSALGGRLIPTTAIVVETLDGGWLEQPVATSIAVNSIHAKRTIIPFLHTVRVDPSTTLPPRVPRTHARRRSRVASHHRVRTRVVRPHARRSR